MAKGKCTGVILDFGPGGIEAVRKNLFIVMADMILKESAPEGFKLTAKELGERAYNCCEFEEFDTHNGFYTIQEYAE